VNWEDRVKAIFHRSNWGVGPRRGLMPLLQLIHEEGRDVEVLGTEIDVADTGFAVQNRDHFVWLDGQCESMVQIHTAGFSYSAALKYKMACGALVLKFESKFEEFYEPALQDGVHVIKLDANDEGVDKERFFQESGTFWIGRSIAVFDFLFLFLVPMTIWWQSVFNRMPLLRVVMLLHH